MNRLLVCLAHLLPWETLNKQLGGKRRLHREGGGARVSDEDCKGDDERHAVLLSHDGHILEELNFGRDQAVRPAGHEERRRKWVDAFTHNEGDLRAG